jgi:hypothetical protein
MAKSQTSSQGDAVPELQALHEQLLGMIDELEALCARPAPDEAALAGLRYRLTRTSGARRKLIETLCVQLRSTLPETEVAPIRALRESNVAAMTSSSDHIGTWSLREIMKNWSGYCQASQQIRRSMRDQIELEKTTLYPHLSSG